MKRKGAPGSDTAPELNRPPWLAAAVVAAGATTAICWPVWPGYMSYDSLLAWDQASYGVQTALWPPLHTYLFQLSRAVGAGPGGLLAAQVFVLLYGAILTLRMVIPGRALGWTMVAFFLGGLAYFPTLLGAMVAHWRDVPTGGFAALGLALWLAAARYRSALLLVPSILAFGVSVGLRYNALILVAPLLALIVWRPYLAPRPGAGVRVLAAILIMASLGLGWASVQWRLPDGARLPNPGGLGGAQLFDVIGISACSGRNYLPAVVTGGRPITVLQLRQTYDPRHLHSTLAAKPGVPKLVETDGGGSVGEVWRRLLVSETGCYLAHRSAVFAEQMGMAKDGVFYPVHSGIDANPYGLSLARPAMATSVSRYVVRHTDEAWRRPYLIYIGALLLVAAAALRHRRWALMLAALLAGAYGYAGVLFVAAPAADARYIFPANLVCLLAGMVALGLLASPRAGRQ